MAGEFDFCPGSNVPENLPRDGLQSSMSLNGWQFVSRPTTPYQRKFKITLHGLRWYIDDSTGRYDYTTNEQFNARALERFYEFHETWSPFIFKHQHFGDVLVRFATPLIVPAGDMNSGGFIKPVEVTLIHHNPGYGSLGGGGSAAPTPSNTRANTLTVRANRSGFQEPLLDLEQRLSDLGG